MRKRIVLGLLAGMLLLSLAACGGDQQVQVGICLRQLEDNLTGEYARVLEETLTQSGYQVQILDAGNDQSKQIQQIGKLLEEETDLLLVEPVMTAEAGEIVKLVKEANVPAIFLQREPDTQVLESWNQLSFVGSGNSKPGQLQGQMVLQLPDSGDINGDGVISYMVIRGPEAHMDAQSRTEECMQALAEGELQTACLRTGIGDWTRQSGEAVCKLALAEFGKDVEVVICNNDEMAIGALAAIQDGGRTVGEDIYLVGIDGVQHAQVLVRSGELTGTVAQDLQGLADQVAATAAALLRGRKVEDRYYVNYIPVTGKNINTFMEN